MIIGLVGNKGSGKDTVGAYLVKEHNFERRAFADPLKRSVAALFNIPFSDVDKLKLDESAYVALGIQTDKVYDQVVRTQSFRQMLQRYGTEAHRDVFGQSFWTDQALPVGGYYTGRAIVITDVRFENEATRINELNGWLVRIVRPADISEFHDQPDTHSSETEQEDIKCDYELTNDDTIEKLYEQVETMLGVLE